MFVYIAHAEADEAAASELKAFLKSRGLVTETESGAKGYRHLQASDVVVGLWSQKAVFDRNRFQMEQRMLEAWAGGQLVLVKVDHGVLPVGLRDLPVIDAGIETGRDLAVWPLVHRAAKDAMNRALIEKEEREDAQRQKGGEGALARHPPDKPPPLFTGFSKTLLRASALICVGAAVLTITTDFDRSHVSRMAAFGILWAAAIFLAIWLAGTVATFLAARKEAGASRKVAAPAAAEEAQETTVFVSYSHADDAAVAPVVKAVEANGRAVWIDKTQVKTGDGWAGEIVRGIKTASRVMVMCSRHAFESDHVKREVYLADRYKKPMSPVFIEEAKPPEDFEYFFAGVQSLELWKLPEAERPAAIGKALAAA